MNPDKVVVHDMDGDCRDMIFEFLREGVGQSSKTAHTHSHSEVLTFDIAGADVLRVGISDDSFLFTGRANCRTVPLLRVGVVSIDLDQHGVVNVFAKAITNRIQVDFETISSHLNSVRETACEILNELSRATGITLAEEPRTNKLAVRVNGDPGPNIADTKFVAAFSGNVLCLGSDELPDFIALNAFGFQVDQVSVKVVGASGPKFQQELRNGVLGSTRNADGGANRAPFHQCPNNLCSFVDAQLVHV